MSAVRPWYRPRYRTLLLLALLAIVAWSVSSYWSDYSEQSERVARELMSPAAGVRCRVVLGSSATGLEKSGVASEILGGRRNYLEGTFVRMNGDWLVIDAAEGDFAKHKWIPRERVLVLEILE